MVALRLRGYDLRTAHPSSAPIAARLGCAVAVAIGGVSLSLSGEAGPWSLALVAASVVIILVAVRPLLPRRTLVAGRGLPSVVLMRALIAGSLFGAEIYVPHLLIDGYGFTSTWAGLGLTAAAIAWAVAADISGRFGDRLGNARITLLGVAQLTLAAVGVGLTAALHLSPAVAIVVWALAGGGMGLMYPRLTVLTLAYSTPQNQGFNSSALSIFDAVGSTMAIAVMGLAFTALGGAGVAYPVVFGIAALLALLALVPGLRLGHAQEAAP
jgi:MFS family permease